jgi:hypothetical protein
MATPKARFGAPFSCSETANSGNWNFPKMECNEHFTGS